MITTHRSRPEHMYLFRQTHKHSLVNELEQSTLGPVIQEVICCYKQQTSLSTELHIVQPTIFQINYGK